MQLVFKTHQLKIMVKIRTLNVIVSRNSENFDVLRLIDIDVFRERGPFFLNCHFVMVSLEERLKEENSLRQQVTT